MLNALSARIVVYPALMVLVMLVVISAPRTAHAEGPVSVADLAERLSGAVVNISTTQKVRQANRGRQGERQTPGLPENSPSKTSSRTSLINNSQISADVRGVNVRQIP